MQKAVFSLPVDNKDSNYQKKSIYILIGQTWILLRKVSVPPEKMRSDHWLIAQESQIV